MPQSAEMDSPRTLHPFPRMDSMHSVRHLEVQPNIARHRGHNVSTMSMSSRFSLTNRLATLEVCLAILQSAREGRDVTLRRQVAVP